MDLTRRRLLQLTGYGAAGLGMAAYTAGPDLFRPDRWGLAGAGAATPPPAPQVISSVGGVLTGTLTVTQDPAWVAGDVAQGTLTYNGLYAGPILRANPGDRVKLKVVNASSDFTINTHFHGMHLTPAGTGDNIFIHSAPGQSFDYDFVIPTDHPGGLYWYHPHVHGSVDVELYSGLAGLIVISGGAETLPGMAGVTERLMALKNAYLTGSGPTWTLAPESSAPNLAAQSQLINGELLPTYTIAPGETQLWRIANTGNDAYYRLALDGHQFQVLAEDGALLWNSFTASELFMPPGKRYEVAVTGGSAGSYQLRQLGYDQGPFGQWPATPMATVEVTGPTGTSVAVPAHPTTRDDLLAEPIANRRVLTLSESFSQATGPLFYINGVLFQDMTPADVVQVTLGTTEEWVLRNDPSTSQGGTTEDHPFHIHVNPFVVTGFGDWDPATGEATSYTPVDPSGTADTINVKPNQYVVIRIKFTDFTGLSVYHCHITFHEDNGMMGEFQVNPPPTPTTTTTTPTTTNAATAVTVTPVYTG